MRRLTRLRVRLFQKESRYRLCFVFASLCLHHNRFTHLSSKHPRKRLTIVGAMFPEIQTWLRGRKLDDVQFIGPKPQAELPGLMSRAHGFVLASIEEGLGLVLAQAMACGCPVIATENSGGPDLITEGVEGFIVPIRDPSAIAERLERLAQDGALRGGMSRACLERVRRCGGWNDYGDSVAHLCHELTN